MPDQEDTPLFHWVTPEHEVSDRIGSSTWTDTLVGTVLVA